MLLLIRGLIILLAKLENVEAENERINELSKELPVPNYNLLKYFIEFLVQVAKYSGANRMGSRNLALVFGASLLNPVVMEQLDLESIKSQCKVIERLIDNYTIIFEGTGSVSEAKHTRAVSTIPAGMSATAPVSLAEKKKKEYKKKRNSLTLQSSPFKGNRSLNFFNNNNNIKEESGRLTSRDSIKDGSEAITDEEKKLKKEKKLKEKKEKKEKKDKKKKKENEEGEEEVTLEDNSNNQVQISESTSQ